MTALDDLDLAHAPGDAPVAFGAELTAPVLLAAYRRGLFPMPGDDISAAFNEAVHAPDVVAGRIRVLPGPAAQDPYALAWWSPDPRPVVAPDRVHLPTRLRRSLRGRLRWHTTADRAFGEVVARCAEGRRPAWLTRGLREALEQLHRGGAAHSAEVWDGTALVGGAFGVAVGGVLSLDSMFRHRPGADRVAVADLAARFGAVDGRLLDAQWDSPHVRAFGTSPMARPQYLRALAAPSAVAPLTTEPLPAARLG
ncbi:leucyl/phenylalanyl-tRNA--protein transferase [Streptomyces sp. TLI_171]|uniref:leucyl/phenylalanyl-tRNA--protein transferase n=1 Tax=Streptomyces sp. TLI_171 TaxID=1938859 RepID=UPI000C19C5F5|nr:leucyl/phenylalanyl-tRNA--protein transferase [Streptomyces sp. TLI_171]RKE16890.1 leucyl/phenylalanyl-tRNA--protein transferase [Streptomyces sp. TLI_171]